MFVRLCARDVEAACHAVICTLVCYCFTLCWYCFILCWYCFTLCWYCFILCWYCFTLCCPPAPLLTSVQAVDTVAQAGQQKSITGFQTHTTPVLLAHGERAELASNECILPTAVGTGVLYAHTHVQAGQCMLNESQVVCDS